MRTYPVKQVSRYPPQIRYSSYNRKSASQTFCCHKFYELLEWICTTVFYQMINVLLLDHQNHVRYYFIILYPVTQHISSYFMTTNITQTMYSRTTRTLFPVRCKSCFTLPSLTKAYHFNALSSPIYMVSKLVYPNCAQQLIYCLPVL